MKPEDQIHEAIFQYLETVLPSSCYVFHPLQNARSKATAARMKRLGFKPGIPDICIVRPAGRVLFIEVKAPKGKLTLPQVAFRAHCRQWGIPHCVAKSIDDVKAFLEAENFETRESAA